MRKQDQTVTCFVMDCLCDQTWDLRARDARASPPQLDLVLALDVACSQIDVHCECVVICPNLLDAPSCHW